LDQTLVRERRQKRTKTFGGDVFHISRAGNNDPVRWKPGQHHILNSTLRAKVHSGKRRDKEEETQQRQVVKRPSNNEARSFVTKTGDLHRQTKNHGGRKDLNRKKKDGGVQKCKKVTLQGFHKKLGDGEGGGNNIVPKRISKKSEREERPWRKRERTFSWKTAKPTSSGRRALKAEISRGRMPGGGGGTIVASDAGKGRKKKNLRRTTETTPDNLSQEKKKKLGWERTERSGLGVSTWKNRGRKRGTCPGSTKILEQGKREKKKSD